MYINHKQGFIPLALLIVILIVVAGGGTYYFVKQKQDNPPVVENKVAQPAQLSVPSDGKTYTNERHGFEFQYPAHMISYSPTDSRLTLSTSSSCFDELMVNKDNDFQSSADCVYVFANIQNNRVFHEPATSQHISFGGIQATEEFYPYGILIQGQRDGIWFIFDLQYGTKSKEKAIQLANNIIATFKFTDKSVTSSDWKTYDGKGVSNEFRYPSNWILREYTYQTPADQAENRPGGVVGLSLEPSSKQSEKDIIEIGGRQFDCRYYSGKCEGQFFDLRTKSTNNEVLDVFEKILSTFKLTK